MGINVTFIRLLFLFSILTFSCKVTYVPLSECKVPTRLVVAKEFAYGRLRYLEWNDIISDRNKERIISHFDFYEFKKIPVNKHKLDSMFSTTCNLKDVKIDSVVISQTDSVWLDEYCGLCIKFYGSLKNYR